jgi:hypothetical protein
VRVGGELVAASATGARNGLAPNSPPGERLAESASAIMASMTRAPRTKRIWACCGPTAASALAGELTVKLVAFGNRVTSLAIDEAETSPLCSPGSAPINTARRAAAASRCISPKLTASCQGSTSARQRGKDGERRAISIAADRRVEELVELRPNERR